MTCHSRPSTVSRFSGVECAICILTMSMFTFSHLKLTPAWPNYLCEITGRQNESSGCQRVAHTPRRDIATHTHHGVETLDPWRSQLSRVKNSSPHLTRTRLRFD